MFIFFPKVYNNKFTQRLQNTRFVNSLDWLWFCENSPFDNYLLSDLPLNGSEAGGDLVLIQTSLALLCKSSCSYAN